MSKQFKAIFILSLLALHSQCVRVSINEIMDLDLEDKCSALEGKIARLCKYISSKVNRVETKGVAGAKGAGRIRKLAQQTAALAAATKSFKEGCEGDLPAASAQLASVNAVIKNLASSGGETTSTLAKAISQAEVELAKPQEEQDLGAIQACFMKTLLGGDEEMTETEKKAVIETNMPEDIVDDALHEADEALLLEDEDLLGRRNNNDNVDALDESPVAQFEQVSANTASSMGLVPVVTGLVPVDIFVAGLKLMSQFLSIIILSVIGLVWWYAYVYSMVATVVLALASCAAAGIICALWWLVGQMAEFVSSGAIAFGKNLGKCMKTIWVTPFATPLVLVNVGLVVGNPWVWMGRFVKGIGKLGLEPTDTVGKLGEAWQATVGLPN